MEKSLEFEDIRPFYDEEFQEKMKSLVKEDKFEHAVKYVLHDVDYNLFSQKLLSLKTKRDFQLTVMVPFLEHLAKTTSSGVDGGGFENISHSGSYVFMSNHRDIVLDASFLNLLLIKKGFESSEVAIGDNLLIFDWISDLVRLNKSFIVKRDVGKRKTLEAACQLSAYIHYTIREKKQSLWIAQREGRAKDSNDRTQESLLKMLGLAGDHDLLSNLKELNIIPVTISYEYDPCDYLKAKEFLLKRDNPEYKKTQEDDLHSMEIGLLGYKGHIHFELSPCINKSLESICPNDNKPEILEAAIKVMDQSIHSNYRIYPGNYVAYDLLHEGNLFANKYTREDHETFVTYINNQLAKITDVPNRDEEFLRKMMLTMYSNPLKNKLTALETQSK